MQRGLDKTRTNQPINHSAPPLMDGGFGEGALSLFIMALRVHTMEADMNKGREGG